MQVHRADTGACERSEQAHAVVHFLLICFLRRAAVDFCFSYLPPSAVTRLFQQIMNGHYVSIMALHHGGHHRRRRRSQYAHLKEALYLIMSVTN